MKHKILFWLAAFIISTALNANDELPAGSAVVGAVNGSATIQDIDGVERPLQAQETLREGDTITTGDDSTVVIMLSNGSAFTIRSLTEVSFQSFRQAPYDAEGLSNFRDLKADPSESHTVIELHEGTVAGNVAKLTDASSYIIRMPGGEVQILGTDYVVTVIRSASGGKTIVQTIITNADGQVVAVIDGNPVNVPIGSSVDIAATRNVSSEGVVTYSVDAVSEPRVASAQEMSIASQAVTEINLVVSDPQGSGDSQEAPVVTEETDTGDDVVVELPSDSTPVPEFTVFTLGLSYGNFSVSINNLDDFVVVTNIGTSTEGQVFQTDNPGGFTTLDLSGVTVGTASNGRTGLTPGQLASLNAQLTALATTANQGTVLVETPTDVITVSPSS